MVQERGLLDHVADDPIRLTRAVVICVLAVAVDTERAMRSTDEYYRPMRWTRGRENIRVALNSIRLAKVRLVDTVDLGELNVLLLEAGSSLLVVGSQSLAVTAPARIRQAYVQRS